MIDFAYTILYVADVEKSIDFHERAFGLKRNSLPTVHPLENCFTLFSPAI